MTAAQPQDAREELDELDERIAELRQAAIDARSELTDISDRASVIEAAEQQEALIAQLEIRRREIIDATG
ncbi:MAG TPA: hypothetical protein VMH41_05035 [Mycobacteriales bacterium]|nr:hypothetical protein [Mycobacteriales bacterium]